MGQWTGSNIRHFCYSNHLLNHHFSHNFNHKEVARLLVTVNWCCWPSFTLITPENWCGPENLIWSNYNGVFVDVGWKLKDTSSSLSECAILLVAGAWLAGRSVRGASTGRLIVSGPLMWWGQPWHAKVNLEIKGKPLERPHLARHTAMDTVVVMQNTHRLPVNTNTMAQKVELDWRRVQPLVPLHWRAYIAYYVIISVGYHVYWHIAHNDVMSFVDSL